MWCPLSASISFCSVGLPSRVASRLRSGISESTVPQSLFLSSPKDTSGGDSCTSEEEPTFDPGYEPDWAVISTVRPRPRQSEPTRGRLTWCPGLGVGGQVETHDLPSVVMAPQALLPTVKMATHTGLQFLESGWGCRVVASPCPAWPASPGYAAWSTPTPGSLIDCGHSHVSPAPGVFQAVGQ